MVGLVTNEGRVLTPKLKRNSLVSSFSEVPLHNFCISRMACISLGLLLLPIFSVSFFYNIVRSLGTGIVYSHVAST